MAEKKQTAAQKKAAEEAAVQAEAERRQTERKRLMGAGAVLLAIALFAGGYAVGNASDDGTDLIGADVVADDDLPRGPQADAPGRPERPGPGDRNPRGDRPRDRFDFPDDFEFGEGLPFFDEDGRPFLPRGGFGFDLPEGFEFPEGGFRFGLECDETGECTFQLPEGFEFPGPGDGPFSGSGDGPGNGQGQTQPQDQPGYLGVAVVESPNGVLVAEVSSGSAADDAGFEVDDVIVAVDGVAIGSVAELRDFILDAGAGAEIQIEIERDGEAVLLEAVLSSSPS